MLDPCIAAEWSDWLHLAPITPTTKDSSSCCVSYSVLYSMSPYKLNHTSLLTVNYLLLRSRLTNLHFLSHPTLADSFLIFTAFFCLFLLFIPLSALP